MFRFNECKTKTFFFSMEPWFVWSVYLVNNINNKHIYFVRKTRCKIGHNSGLNIRNFTFIQSGKVVFNILHVKKWQQTVYNLFNIIHFFKYFENCLKNMGSGVSIFCFKGMLLHYNSYIIKTTKYISVIS